MTTATNIQREMAGRVQGLSAGGIGAMLLLAHRIGLIRRIMASIGATYRSPTRPQLTTE
jgi:hypothetical protein